MCYYSLGFFLITKKSFVHIPVSIAPARSFRSVLDTFPGKDRVLPIGFGLCLTPARIKELYVILHFTQNDDPFLHMVTYLFFKCLDSKSTPSICKSNLVFHSSVLRDFDVNSTNCIQKPHEYR